MSSTNPNRSRRRATARPVGAAIISALALSLWALPASAQTHWDARQYGRWIDQGTELYDEALELPPEAAWRRTQLLRDSARVKLLARAMLRAALASGEVNDFRDAAIGEYFNLCENLIVHLSNLDQCEAAALLIDQVEQDDDILPVDAASTLRGLESTIGECRMRIARPDPSWGLEWYRRLIGEAEGWRRQAQDVDGTPEADSLRFEAAQREQQALELLRGTLLGTGQAPGLDEPDAALLDHYPRLIADLSAIGACDVARRRAQQHTFDAEVLGATSPHTGLIDASVAACEPP